MDFHLVMWGSLLAGDKPIGDRSIATIAAPTVSVSFGSDGFWAENPSLHSTRPRPLWTKPPTIKLSPLFG